MCACAYAFVAPVVFAGAEGVCLGDVAAFWKSFVQELRFLWEESASVPQMVRCSGFGLA